MDNYLNLGPRDAAHDDISMEHTDFTELNLAEIDNIAQQLEWENLTNIDPMTTQFLGQYINQEHIDPSLTMEHYLPSECHQYSTSETSLEQSTQGSPGTSTATSVLETPPMPDYDLPVDWAATWDMNTLGMFPDLLDFPLDTDIQCPIMDDLWLNGDLGSVPMWDETLQYQQPKENPFSSEVPHNDAIPSSSTTSTSPAETGSEDIFTCSFCSFTATSITKFKTHINKHTRPFRCTAPSCDYATAEKKSLQRHVLAKAKWDEGHRVAAETLGVKEVKYRCPRAGCEYATIREDNLRRHVAKCPGKG